MKDVIKKINALVDSEEILRRLWEEQKQINSALEKKLHEYKDRISKLETPPAFSKVNSSFEPTDEQIEQLSMNYVENEHDLNDPRVDVEVLCIDYADAFKYILTRLKKIIGENDL